MDSLKPIIASPQIGSVKAIGAEAEAKGISEQKKEKIAKDFESVFIYRLLMEMNSTIGQWGLEKEQGDEQVQSLFALCLSEYVSKNGGVGLWKDIKASLEPPQLNQKADVEVKL